MFGSVRGQVQLLGQHPNWKVYQPVLVLTPLESTHDFGGRLRGTSVGNCLQLSKGQRVEVGTGEYSRKKRNPDTVPVAYSQKRKTAI